MESKNKKFNFLKKFKSFFNSSDLAENKRKSEDFKKPKMFDEKDIEKMVLLKEKGFSNVKVGKIMKCSEKTVRNYLKANSTPWEMGQD